MTEDQFDRFMASIDQRFAEVKEENRILREDVDRHQRIIVGMTEQIRTLNEVVESQRISISGLLTHIHDMEEQMYQLRKEVRAAGGIPSV